MPDAADRFAEKKLSELEKRIASVYKRAAKDVQEKLDSFVAEHLAEADAMLKKVESGEITQKKYSRWLKQELFKGKQWAEKVDDMTRTYVKADKAARNMVNDTDMDVFVASANYTARDINSHMRGAVSFSTYDKTTVRRLLKDNPKMLPEWKINEKKDYVWNEKRVQNAVLQGIIQGEPIPRIAERLTVDLAASNDAKMNMFARTAVTGSQNAGRIERLHEAQELGIEVRKKWIATTDDRTRDAHRDLNGVDVGVDEDFENEFGRIAFPGDPNADPANVYNCRCTLGYVYPKYQPSKG